LPGGEVLTVRSVTPADVDGLVALYDGLSDDDRYRRFFSGFRPPRSFFERLVNVGERGGYGLVATAGSDGDVVAGARIVGEASYELLPNGDGELAITVAADHRGWLGPYLLDALVEAAAARGVPNLEADVLATNGPMLALLRSRGDARMGPNDWSTARLLVGTAGRTPVWPAGHGATGQSDRPRVLVEVPGGRWHAGTEADAAGLRVIACSGPRGARPRCPVVAGRPCPLAATADAIVVSNAPDDDRWRALLGAHTALHPGVPVCVERRVGRGHRDQPQPETPDRGSAVALDENQDPRMIVDLVDRLASRHRIASCDPTAPAPRRNGRS
jgi:ribosomal protein S18 acetylase RimI-like enzyme